MPFFCRATGTPGTSDNSTKGQPISEREYSFSDEVFATLDTPADIDLTRWSMLSDRRFTRLYFFKKGSDTCLYQFIFDGKAFHCDGKHDPYLITIKGADAKADPSSIGMLSTPNFEQVKGYNQKVLPVPNNYHVYMLNKDEAEQGAAQKHTLYQYIWEKGTANLEANGITSDKFSIGEFPKDTDWQRWSINYDSNRYQLAFRSYVISAFQKGRTDLLYQGRFDNYGTAEAPLKEYRYTERAKLIGAPENVIYDTFASVFDGIQTHFYFLLK